MTWATQLKRIRRYLRDPNGNIWNESLLKNIFNDIQRDVQERTGILEDVQAIRVPPSYQYSYMFDHEWGKLPSTNSQFYQCLRIHHQSNQVVCYEWEAQAINDIDDGAPDEGAQFTQPWEAFMSLTPGMEVRFRFPKNFHSLKYIAYDREPIDFYTKKEITNNDPSYITREGEPVGYYRPDDLDNSFVPYPRPSTSFTDELIGGETGLVLYNSDDTLGSEYGVTLVRDGTVLSGQTGADVNQTEIDDNFFIVYNIIPTEVVDKQDDIDYPAYMGKYIEYGVLSRAYRVNNDGNIPSLAEYWDYRYELGIQFIKEMVRKRLQDRDFRLGTKQLVTHRKRHPRLPDGYPSCR